MNTIRLDRKIAVVAVASLSLIALSAPVAFADHGDAGEGKSHATTVHTHATTHTPVATKSAIPAAKLEALKKQLDALIALAKSKGYDVKAHGSAAAHSHDDDHHAEGAFHSHHELFEAGKDAPTLKIEIHPGAKEGYAVFADTSLTFAPKNADGAHVKNEGHAHIYVDGVKISRMYGPWYYLAPLKEKGKHTITIELSTNDHKSYAHDGERVTASAEIVVK